MIVEAATSRTALLLAQVQVKPDDSKAPGINALQDLVNGLAAYAVVAAVAAVLLGGIAWALGERMGLDRASTIGKSGVLAGFGLAFLVGAAAVLVNFFLATGSTASTGSPKPNGLGQPGVVLVVDDAAPATGGPGVVYDQPSSFS
jgi:hypothetical protein